MSVFLAVFSIFVSQATVLFAESLLTVHNKNAESASKEFSRSDLQALPQEEIVTETVWTKGRTVFSGPPLSAIIDAAGLGDGALELVAANGYFVRMEREIIEEDVPIVALLQNGNPMSMRQKGPLWVIFPYDSDEKYQVELIYALSVWQLVEIRILGNG